MKPTTLPDFSSLRVGVIGDLMLDSYVMGTSHRLCREAPVPIVEQQSVEEMPGGAANTVLNVSEMGAEVVFVSVAGNDAEASSVMAQLQTKGVDTTYIHQSSERQTLTKKRIVADKQLMIRYDYGSDEPISAKIETHIKQSITRIWNKIDTLIISDYRYGILTPALRKYIAHLQQLQPKLLVVDAKDLSLYQSIKPTIVKPNYQEAVGLLGVDVVVGNHRHDQMRQYQDQLLSITGASAVALTLDSDGGIVFQEKTKPFTFTTQAIANPQVAGAGDTFVSALALAMTADLPLTTAVNIAATAATVAIQKTGTAVCSWHELAQAVSGHNRVQDNKENIVQKVKEYRKNGKKIVCTTGFFDGLQPVHLEFLRAAKKRGDVLIVGVNGDKSAAAIKGAGEVVHSAQDRVTVLSAIDVVDHAVVFDEYLPNSFIEKIKPDIYVKGSNYARMSLAEIPVVTKHGGVFELISVPKDGPVSPPSFDTTPESYPDYVPLHATLSKGAHQEES